MPGVINWCPATNHLTTRKVRTSRIYRSNCRLTLVNKNTAVRQPESTGVVVSPVVALPFARKSRPLNVRFVSTFAYLKAHTFTGNVVFASPACVTLLCIALKDSGVVQQKLLAEQCGRSGSVHRASDLWTRNSACASTTLSATLISAMAVHRRRAQVKTKAETALSINEIIDAPCFARRNNPVRRRWTSLHRVKGCSHVRINRSKVVSRALANLYIFYAWICCWRFHVPSYTMLMSYGKVLFLIEIFFNVC